MPQDLLNVRITQEILSIVVRPERLFLKSMGLGVVLLLRQHHLVHRPALVLVVRGMVFPQVHWRALPGQTSIHNQSHNDVVQPDKY